MTALPMSPVGKEVVQALKAVHDQRESGNIKYVNNIAKKLAGRNDFACILYINQLDMREISALANRMKTDSNLLSQASLTLRCFN